MSGTISNWRSVQRRHEAAPLLQEREQYLTHLLQRGFDRSVVRSTAAYLLHIVRVMNMSTLRTVGQEEIDAAGRLWAAYEGPLRKRLRLKGSPITFVRIAQKWFRFHDQLALPAQNRFQHLITKFADAMRCRGLASATVDGYSFRALAFLYWYGERHDSLEFVSLQDTDEFLASKREEGWTLRTLATGCQAPAHSESPTSTACFSVHIGVH